VVYRAEKPLYDAAYIALAEDLYRIRLNSYCIVGRRTRRTRRGDGEMGSRKSRQNYEDILYNRIVY